MIGDVARNIAGDDAQVDALMGPGVDPHLYQPTPRDLTRLRAAQLVLYNGLHLEGKMVEVFESLAQTKQVVAVTRDIPEDTVLDNAPIIPIPRIEEDLVTKTVLNNYTYEWDDPTRDFALVIIMSPCQFINHSYHPNAMYCMDYEAESIVFRTFVDIPRGEEITVNYNGAIFCKEPLWFDPEED